MELAANIISPSTLRVMTCTTLVHQKMDIKNLNLFRFLCRWRRTLISHCKVKRACSDHQGKPVKRNCFWSLDLDHGVEVAPKFLRDDGSYDFSLINNEIIISDPG